MFDEEGRYVNRAQAAEQTAQLPMFRLLATPDQDKRYVVFETAHDVSVMRHEMIAAVLEWLDRYLGRVK